MKKIVIAFIAGVIFATAGTAAATTIIERVTASVRSDYSVELDGRITALKNPPLAYNGSSYLPVKEISELLGKEVGFDSGVIKINTPKQIVTEVDRDQRDIETFKATLSVPVESLNWNQIKSELTIAPMSIQMLKTSITYGEGMTNEELSLRKDLIAQFEQRLKDLEARKAELES